MTNKQKVLIASIIGMVILGGGIIYLTYLGLTPDEDRVSDIEEKAQSYLEENYSNDYQIVDTFYDNVDVYESFSYAAIVESESDDRFRFLIFEDNETNELTDSYVAESFEYELESILRPKLYEAFGEENIHELWMTYPKDAGKQLDLNHQQVASVKEYDLKPMIRVSLDRGENDNDKEQLDQIIKEIQEELSISGGHFTLSFNDNAIIFKDKDIQKEF